MIMRRRPRKVVTKQESRRTEGQREGRRHRYLPFVCDELVDADGREGAPLPRLVAPVLSLGFFAAEVVASADDARGASLLTIFAWISSSFPALTFLGQNSVTKLEGDGG